jgi:hypothetical protein
VADKGGISTRIGWPAAIAWLATVVAPPAVAGGLWEQFVSSHVLLALAIGTVYEVAVAIVGFFAVIAREVSSRWQQRLAEHLDLALRRKLSGFEKRYREFLLTGLRFVDLKGLATIGPFTPELEEVFVDVSLVSRSPHKIQPGVLGELARSERHALSEFIGRRQAVILAVVGAPGSGKTTLLRHTARRACIQAGPFRKTNRDIPILLYLRDHSAEIVRNSSVSLVALARKGLGALVYSEPQGWFERQLRSGRCLVLLDGFDEVARQSDRAKVADWVGRQVQYYPGNDFVISSRPHGYQTAPVTGAEVVQVCGFTVAQTESFIRGWYQAIERHSTGAEGADIEARAQAEADDLLRRLEVASALHDLTVNPLLLTMIINVHRYRGALPGNRAELYSEICQVMLWRRQDAKNLASQINGDKKEAILRTLAYFMMDGRVADLPRDDLITVINPVLRRQSKRVQTDDFLTEILASGLLIERETEQFSFAHHTFQEYLAASHIRENALVNVLADAVSDPWWRETTLLYAARSDADAIIAACLSANNLTALALAFECVDQDSAFDPDLHAQLDELLDSVHDPDSDPARRRLMGGVLLTRHLRDQIRTPIGHRLCVRPINRGIYSIFQTETGTPKPDAKYSDEPTDEVIVGVRRGDALAFVEWANVITGDTNVYRLPTTESLNYQMERQAKVAPSIDRHMNCVWARNRNLRNKIGPFLWVPGGVMNPQTVGFSALHSSIESDIIKVIPPDALKLLSLGLAVMAKVSVRSPTQEIDPELALVRAPAYEITLEKFDDKVAVLVDALEKAGAASYQFNSGFSADLSLAFCVVLARMLGKAERNVRTIQRDLIQIPEMMISDSVVRNLLDALTRANALTKDTISQFTQERTTFEHVGGDAIYDIPSSLVDSITVAAKEAGTAAGLPQALAKTLVDRAFIAAGLGGSIDLSKSIDLSELSSDLVNTTVKFPQELSGVTSQPTILWLQMIDRRFREEAIKVFSRKTAATPQVSTLIRLSALLLAGELKEAARRLDLEYKRSKLLSRQEPESAKSELLTRNASLFSNAAEGITWLERRENGMDLATETIMLAVE